MEERIRPTILWIAGDVRPRETGTVFPGYPTRCAGTLAEARDELRGATPDVVFIDSELPDGRGDDLVAELSSSSVFLLSADPTADAVAETLSRPNVVDYLVKPVDWDSIGEHLRVLSRVGSAPSISVDDMVGESPPMQDLRRQVRAVAATDASVLIVGESGTGKELVARGIHARSARRSRPLVAINCGAIPESLIESELFGHEKGAFTGARDHHAGCFERADGGTLFLDEIGEMPAELQVRLLRVVETGLVTRVGGDRTIEVDVRIVAATNRSPQEAIEEGSLREDLAYRLSVFPIVVTPLRERGEEDIDLLSEYFLARLNLEHDTEKTISDELRAHFRARNWPGNVRELRNAVSRAFIVAEDELREEHLSGLTIQSEPHPVQVDTVEIPVGSTIEDAERLLILATLDHADGDRKRAAEVLGISVRTLYERLRRYREEGIEP